VFEGDYPDIDLCASLLELDVLFFYIIFL
jgi:hypothetical protein